MEFVSRVEDMLTVVGEVRALENNRGIQMDLPPGLWDIDRIVYGHASTENLISRRSLQ